VTHVLSSFRPPALNSLSKNEGELSPHEEAAGKVPVLTRSFDL